MLDEFDKLQLRIFAGVLVVAELTDFEWSWQIRSISQAGDLIFVLFV